MKFPKNRKRISQWGITPPVEADPSAEVQAAAEGEQVTVTMPKVVLGLYYCLMNGCLQKKLVAEDLRVFELYKLTL